MIRLNKFNLHKLYGYIYAICGIDDKAIEEFNLALNIKEDGQTYYQMAYSYAYLREYKKAQECTLRAIELGYDAYQLYVDFTWGNLRHYGDTMKVLREGVEKKFSSACLLMADFAEFFHEKGELLDKAFEYAKAIDKKYIAYEVYKRYKVLQKDYNFFYKENKALYYYKLFNEYGGFFTPVHHVNIALFNETLESNDEEIIQILFDRFDVDAQVIFLFILLEIDYRVTNESFIDRSKIYYLLITHLAEKENNQIGRLLKTYADSESHLKMQTIFNMNRLSDFDIPTIYKEPFDMFIDAYIDLMLELEM